MSDLPKDWPEDKKVGPGFLAELMKRYPNQVKVGTLEEGEEWLKKEQDEAGYRDGKI